MARIRVFLYSSNFWYTFEDHYIYILGNWGGICYYITRLFFFQNKYLEIKFCKAVISKVYQKLDWHVHVYFIYIYIPVQLLLYFRKSRLSDVRKYNNSWTGSIHIYTHIYIWHVHNSPRLFVLYSCNFWYTFENQYISVTFEITEIPILIGVVITIELKLFFWTFAFTIWLQFSTVLFSYTE